jgi:hypothetical protein
MNILTANPSFGTTVARQLIAERVADADARRAAYAARAARRTSAQTPSPTEHPMSWWAVRFLHPVH